ncbi:5-oxoprolinase subunit PxpB [Clostridium minihomine]|uniref:5-oxoprolinase subunit PxpB n=1 Tax=Clostridium minihomine TaxID=2045012 RepID=UPI000C793225|nr:5-oxoprolinase subunit PxpB [Clostridium minihomine]
MYSETKYLIAGDSAIVVEFGDKISPQINESVRGMYLAIEQSGLPGVVSLTPTYRSLLVQYDSLIVPYAKMLEELKKLEGNLKTMELPEPNVLEIPTLYGGECGPDLDFVCQNSGLSKEEVIQIHTSREYLIYMLGFAPGFPYLGGMDERIATPRLKTPRTKINSGSVGIAGQQTGIYPMASPGGWQLIGRTPILLYDPMRNPPILYKTGDYLKFIPIDEQEYETICKQVEEGSYQYKLYPKKEAGK